MDSNLSFTICFLIKDNHVLLIKRNKPPWLHHWNAVGGKLERDEKPHDGVIREVIEETGITMKKSDLLTFTAIVTWASSKGSNGKNGMYAFIAELAGNQLTWTEQRATREGVLAWKPLAWALDKQNPEIAQNLPAFLSLMLTQKKPMEYFCRFDKKGNFLKVEELSY